MDGGKSGGWWREAWDDVAWDGSLDSGQGRSTGVDEGSGSPLSGSGGGESGGGFSESTDSGVISGGSCAGSGGGGTPPSVPGAAATPEEPEGEGPGYSKPPAVRRLFTGPRPGSRSLRSPEESRQVRTYTSAERFLLLDLFERSSLPLRDFCELVGLAEHTLYQWKRAYRKEGVAGLLDRPRGARKGSRLPEATKRAVLRMKEENPDWGVERISAVLMRDPALRASPTAILSFLKEKGYQSVEEPTSRHEAPSHRFERGRPNRMWQTDFFDFVLPRQNRMVHLIAYIDDHSRYVVGYGLHASATAALAIETLRAAIASYGKPDEVLTDQGPQYKPWRGTGEFQRALEAMKVVHLVCKENHPETHGKAERFWETLHRELVDGAFFWDLEDARRRIGHFVDWYNFRRPHKHLGRGLVPADRYFEVADEMRKALSSRVAENALEIARHGVPRKVFYLVGNVGGKPFSVHEAGGRLYLLTQGGERQEVDLASPKSVELTGLPTEVVADVEKRWEEHRSTEGEVPEPLCPSASPERGSHLGLEQPLPAGVSVLDGLAERLAKARAATSAEVAGADAAPEEGAQEAGGEPGPGAASEEEEADGGEA